jgi:hypothetical protein
LLESQEEANHEATKEPILADGRSLLDGIVYLDDRHHGR